MKYMEELPCNKQQESCTHLQELGVAAAGLRHVTAVLDGHRNLCQALECAWVPGPAAKQTTVEGFSLNMPTRLADHMVGR